MGKTNREPLMKMLVIADRPLERPVALEKAARIAQAIGAEVAVAGFAYDAEIEAPKSSESKRKKREIIAENKKRLEALSKDIFSPTIPFTVDSVWTDDIDDWVAKTVKDAGFELIVKSGHRSERLFHTPLDWKLIRHTTAPLLIVTPSKWHAHSRVLATVDVETDDPIQTDVNKDVLKLGSYLAQAMDGEMHIATCISTSQVLSDMDLVSLDRKEAKKSGVVSRKMSDLLSGLDIPTSECHVRAGNVVKIILDISNATKADIVVMGSVGRKKLKGLIIGSTAENLLQNINRDVLVMRPDHFNESAYGHKRTLAIR